MDDPRPKRALSGLLAGGAFGFALVALAGGAVLYAYWLHRCGIERACDDPARVVRWALAHALLMGMHGAAIGGVLGLIAGMLGARAGKTLRRAGLAGFALALPLGLVACRGFWSEPGTRAVAVIALPLHALVGALVAMARRRWP